MRATKQRPQDRERRQTGGRRAPWDLARLNSPLKAIAVRVTGEASVVPIEAAATPTGQPELDAPAPPTPPMLPTEAEERRSSPAVEPEELPGPLPWLPLWPPRPEPEGSEEFRQSPLTCAGRERKHALKESQAAQLTTQGRRRWERDHNFARLGPPREPRLVPVLAGQEVIVGEIKELN